MLFFEPFWRRYFYGCTLSDEELLKSASLYGRDRVTGEQGYNLAAVMLLGKDDVIMDVAPAYVTDALLRRVNVDRYDDREVIKTNLIESYEQLMDFGRKHLLDKFFLEDDQRKSLRSIITREIIANTLIHREYTSSYQAKFVIERDQMYVENANRASQETIITPDNLEPNPKNPIIASFFRNIGYADQLGSGVRNLFKYSKYYSGKEPEFVEGDVFKIIVPLDDRYSFDKGKESGGTGSKYQDDTLNDTLNDTLDDTLEMLIIDQIRKNPKVKQSELVENTGNSIATIKRTMKRMVEQGIIQREGGKRNGTWIIM